MNWRVYDHYDFANPAKPVRFVVVYDFTQFRGKQP